MCKYCEYSNDARFGANMLDDEYGESAASSIDINFCPICGRKL